MVAYHVVNRAVKFLKLVKHFLDSCHGFSFWAEAVDNVPEIDGEFNVFVMIPFIDGSLKNLDAVAVISRYS